MVMAAWLCQTMLWNAEDIQETLARTNLLNFYQILRLIRIVIFAELSRTGMRCQAKLMILSLQTNLKKSYLSILVNDEF